LARKGKVGELSVSFGPFKEVVLNPKPTSNGSDEVGSSNILHVTDSSGSLDIDHVGFMPQQTLEELVHLSLNTGY
jgi:hypothetical protein